MSSCYNCHNKLLYHYNSRSCCWKWLKIQSMFEFSVGRKVKRYARCSCTITLPIFRLKKKNESSYTKCNITENKNLETLNLREIIRKATSLVSQSISDQRWTFANSKIARLTDIRVPRLKPFEMSRTILPDVETPAKSVDTSTTRSFTSRRWLYFFFLSLPLYASGSAFPITFSTFESRLRAALRSRWQEL